MNVSTAKKYQHMDGRRRRQRRRRRRLPELLEPWSPKRVSVADGPRQRLVRARHPMVITNMTFSSSGQLSLSPPNFFSCLSLFLLDLYFSRETVFLLGWVEPPPTRSRAAAASAARGFDPIKLHS